MSGEAPAKSAALTALGIRIIDDFVDTDFLSDMQKVCSQAAFVAASIYRGGEMQVDELHRRTKELLVPIAVRTMVRDLFRTSIEQVNGWYATTIQDCASPLFLRYVAGDFFIAHADRSTRGREAELGGRRAVSAVLFLNGRREPGFLGGELLLSPFDDPVWNTHGFEVEPRAGRLVLFPSTMMHEVKTVVAGERLTVVTWFETAFESEERTAAAR